MKSGTHVARKRDEGPRDAEPSDAPLAVVYLGIIACAVTIMIAVAVAVTA